MFDLNKVEYRVVVVTQDGTQLDVTPITYGLGWSEEAKELSAKITLKLASTDYGGKNISEVVTAFTPIYVYANGEEVCHGSVTKLGTFETNSEFYLDVECADEVQALRKNQDQFYFSEGMTTTAILEEILSKWGVPHEFVDLQDVTHSKKVFNKKYLIDMIEDILKDVKEKGGGVYYVQSIGGVIKILPRGKNEIIYHFDVDQNLVRVNESFDVSNIVTRVQVVGKLKEEGHQRVESTVDGKTDLGVRQVIYERGDKESAEEAETAAKKILEEQGDAKHDLSLEAPDLPTLRKSHKIRVQTSGGEPLFYFVKSISHNAVTQKMSLTLDIDKDATNYDVARTDESNSSAPP